jgi:malonyl-CoA O-methyltransferase
MIDKNTVKKSFSKAARSYDSNSGFQRSVAEDLLKFLGSILESRRPAYAGPIFHGIPQDIAAHEARILDIGCGTGGLGRGIKGLFPGAILCAADIALPMLAKAGENLNNAVELVQADCEALPFRGSTFDIVASSLAYQWTESFSAFKEANRVLKKNGLLVFSTLGPGTLLELRECLSVALPSYTSPMTYKGPVALAHELERAGFNVESIDCRNTVRTYENMMSLIRTLKMIGASPPLKGLSVGPSLRRAGRIYKERYSSIDGKVLATYEVIFAAARKD